MASIYTVLLSDGEGSPSPGYIAAAIVGVLLVLLLASIAIFFLRRRKQKPPEAETSSRYGIEIKNNEIESSEANDDGTYLYTKAEVEEEPLPSHISLWKNANLKEKAKDISQRKEAYIAKHEEKNLERSCHVFNPGNFAYDHSFAVVYPTEDNVQLSSVGS